MEVRSMRYAQVRSMDISNGEGIGVSLFVQGCPFNPHCKNCFNTETWDFNGGKEWTPDVKEKFLELIDRPYIKRVSILGGEPLADENLDGVLDLVTEINKRYNFQKVGSANPCKMGISEAENPDEIRILSSHKNIWLYTGYKLIIDYSESKRQRKTVFTLLPYANTNVVNDINEYRRLCENDDKRRMIAESVDFIVDGRYIDEQRDITLKWRGSSNQRVIDVKQSLAQNKIVLYCN